MSKLLKIIQFQNILPIFDIKLSRKTPLRAHSIESVTLNPDTGIVYPVGKNSYGMKLEIEDAPM